MDLQKIKSDVESEIVRLQRVLKALGSVDVPSKKTRTGHHMSAAARRRISAAQRARWAKLKKG